MKDESAVNVEIIKKEAKWKSKQVSRVTSGADKKRLQIVHL